MMVMMIAIVVSWRDGTTRRRRRRRHERSMDVGRGVNVGRDVRRERRGRRGRDIDRRGGMVSIGGGLPKPTVLG